LAGRFGQGNSMKGKQSHLGSLWSIISNGMAYCDNIVLTPVYHVLVVVKKFDFELLFHY
jgi:hypothetical protein